MKYSEGLIMQGPRQRALVIQSGMHLLMEGVQTISLGCGQWQPACAVMGEMYVTFGCHKQLLLVLQTWGLLWLFILLACWYILRASLYCWWANHTLPRLT